MLMTANSVAMKSTMIKPMKLVCFIDGDIQRFCQEHQRHPPTYLVCQVCYNSDNWVLQIRDLIEQEFPGLDFVYEEADYWEEDETAEPNDCCICYGENDD